LRQQRILVVDSEIYVAHLLEFSLGMEGYHVVVTGTGEQAREWYASGEQVDLALIADDLSDGSGLELCRELHESDGLAELPIFLLSGKGNDLTEEQAREYEVSRLLRKPVSTPVLIKAVKMALNGQSADGRDVIRTL
jgi:CheY-like chemotaxis protein